MVDSTDWCLVMVIVLGTQLFLGILWLLCRYRGPSQLQSFLSCGFEMLLKSSQVELSDRPTSPNNMEPVVVRLCLWLIKWLVGASLAGTLAWYFTHHGYGQTHICMGGFPSGLFCQFFHLLQGTTTIRLISFGHNPLTGGYECLFVTILNHL